MNPKLLFWVPAALRMVLALLGVAIVWYLFGATYALGIAFVLILASEGLRMVDWKTLLKNRMPRAVQPKLTKEVA